MATRILLSLASIFLALCAPAQSEYMGSPPITNYAPKLFLGGSQVFDITQDGRGIIHFTNKRGIYAYDGNAWHNVENPYEIREVNCLARHKNGVLYYGGNAKFGHLDVDKETGQMVMRPMEDSAMKEFRDVNWIEFSGDTTYFISREEVIIYENYDRIGRIELKRTKEGKEDGKARYFFRMNGEFYFSYPDSLGLFRLDNGTLVKAEGWEKFLDDIPVTSVEFDGKTFLPTESGKLFQVLGRGRYELVNADFPEISCALNVNDQYLILGTRQQGIIVLDKSLRVRSIIDDYSGLYNKSIKCMYLDRQGQLWLGTNNGLSKVEILTNVSKLGKQNQLTSIIEAIAEADSTLWMATQIGPIKMIQKDGRHIFVTIPQEGGNNDCYDIGEFRGPWGTKVLLGAADGILEYIPDGEGGQGIFKKLYDKSRKLGPWKLVQSKRFPERIYVLDYFGLRCMVWNGEAFDLYEMDDFPKNIHNGFTTETGELWAGLMEGGVLTFKETKDLKNIKPIVYSNESWYSGGPCYMAHYQGRVLCGTQDGMFEFNGEVFKRTDDLAMLRNSYIHRLSADGERLWVIFQKQDKWNGGYFHTSDEGQIFEDGGLGLFIDDVCHAITHLSDGKTVIGSTEYEAYLCNPAERRSGTSNFEALILGVYHGLDTLFTGAAYDKQGFLSNLIPDAHMFDYGSGSMKFYFGSNSYVDEGKTMYRYKLEGQDEQWSAWTTRNEINYTNLHEGEYTFMLQARNAVGDVSDISSYTFSITPPWYRTTWAYISGILAFVLLLYLVVQLSLLRVKRQNQRLEALVQERTKEVVEQKTLVERKNAEIVDSINYAKRLQNAIMPSRELMTDKVGDTMILYMPKDIVAGDFFWMETEGDEVWVAAADCTGHGVPGAMVSVVCANALNRAFKEMGMRQPGHILDKVRDIVIETYTQGGEAVRDGMDISLVRLNLKTLELSFAGAQNPIWIVRPGSSTASELVSEKDRTDVPMRTSEFHGQLLVEVKGDNQPIGIYEKMTQFSTHHIQLGKGDTFYLFSDGYADQFGGERGKKLKYRTFKEILCSMQDEPMKDQENVLERSFNDWKGHYEQVDDVCVIGVRV